jgi:hypothetical protein
MFSSNKGVFLISRERGGLRGQEQFLRVRG